MGIIELGSFFAIFAAVPLVLVPLYLRPFDWYVDLRGVLAGPAC